MLYPKAKYIKIIIVLLLLLPGLTANVVSQQRQDFSPATCERIRLNSSPQGLFTNPDYQVERNNTPTAPSPTAVGPYYIPRAKPHVFGPVPFVKSFFHRAAAILERVLSGIRQYKTRDISDSPYALALLDSLALSSTSVLAGAKFIKSEYFDIFVGYCNRTNRYLKAAREYEKSLLLLKAGQSDDSDQRPTRSISLQPSRDNIVDVIAMRADLRAEEVTHLALVLERGARSIERWSYGGGSLSMRIRSLWRFPSGQWLWQLLSDWWQSLQRSIAIYSALAVFCLIGGNLLATNGSGALCLAGLLFIIGVIYLP